MNDVISVVDKQLIAYNERDYETFASCYCKDICSYDLATQRLNSEMSGIHFFRHYKNKFMENPNIHCEVIKRILHGNLVVDYEIISDYRNCQFKDLVIYQIDGERISKMWFPS